MTLAVARDAADYAKRRPAGWSRPGATRILVHNHQHPETQATTVAPLAPIAAAMVQAFPTERTRIERALAVAQLRRILPTATVGRYLVECGDLRGGAGVPLYYDATSLTCCCP